MEGVIDGLIILVIIVPSSLHNVEVTYVDMLISCFIVSCIIPIDLILYFVVSSKIVDSLKRFIRRNKIC